MIINAVDFRETAQSNTPHQRLNHYPLNEIEGLKNPSSENIDHWILSRIKPTLPFLHNVEIAETCDASCVYRED